MKLYASISANCSHFFRTVPNYKTWWNRMSGACIFQKNKITKSHINLMLFYAWEQLKNRNKICYSSISYLYCSNNYIIILYYNCSHFFDNCSQLKKPNPIECLVHMSNKIYKYYVSYKFKRILCMGTVCKWE